MANIETDDLGSALYDVVLCDNILHHVVPSLELVVRKAKNALKPGGQFIAREPVAYARWLKAIRRSVPVQTSTTPDEQSLRRRELAIILEHFPNATLKYFEIVSRIRSLTNKGWVVAGARRVDHLLLKIPGANTLAGLVVICAKREE